MITWTPHVFEITQYEIRRSSFEGRLGRKKERLMKNQLRLNQDFMSAFVHCITKHLKPVLENDRKKTRALIG